MGGLLSQFWWGGDPDAVNPVSGLTKRDVHAVQKSWALANANPVATGTELFRRLFRAHPETKGFFRMVRNVPEDELPQNLQFRAHVMNIMSSITLAVNNLNQPEVVAAMMNKLGESHGRRKIEEIHFDHLKGVLVQMFVEILKLDDSTLESWEKTVEFLYKHIFKTLNYDETR